MIDVWGANTKTVSSNDRGRGIMRRVILLIVFYLSIAIHITHNNLYAFHGETYDFLGEDQYSTFYLREKGLGIILNIKPGEPGDESKKVQRIPYAGLKEAMYGIPLSATIDEVIKWCVDNKVSIKNNSASQIKQYIEEQAKFAPALANAIGNYINKTMTYDEKREQEAREEFYKAIAPSLPENIPPGMQLAFGANYADVMKQELQQRAVVNIKQALELIKSPSFSWNNERYFLKPIFKGIEVSLKNEKLICVDDRITRTAYVLKVEPSEQMKRQLLDELNIYFYANKEGHLKSYAVVGRFRGWEGLGYNPEELFVKIIDTLKTKYGEPRVFRSDGLIDESNNIMHLINYHLVYPRGGAESGVAIFWKRNILLHTNFDISSGYVGVPPTMRDVVEKYFGSWGWGGYGFGILYYDPTIAQELINLHITAIKEQIEQRSNQMDSIKKGIEKSF